MLVAIAMFAVGSCHMTSSFQKVSSVVGDGTSLIKTNDEHGLVFGFGMVSMKKNSRGEYVPYYDSGELLSTGTRRVDHIPEDALLKASLEYARGGRVAGDEHRTAAQSQLLKAAESIKGIVGQINRAAVAE